MGILAIYDTTGIQSYIFASNKLRENSGASLLINKVLNKYLSQVLIESFTDGGRGENAKAGEGVPESGEESMLSGNGGISSGSGGESGSCGCVTGSDRGEPSGSEGESCNLSVPGGGGGAKVIIDWKSRCSKPLEIAGDAEIFAEIIYVGGGNAYIAFKNKDAYLKATEKFLFKLYDDTAGISITSAFVETDFTYGYDEQFRRLQKELSYAKGKINHPIPAGNQPITTASILTGLPVTGYKRYAVRGSDQPPAIEWLSAEQLLKRDAHEAKYGEETEKYREFSDLERGNNFLAVIHLDGNSMGNAILDYAKGDNWNDVVPRIREMSYRISRLYETAYEQTARKLAKHCSRAEEEDDGEDKDEGDNESEGKGKDVGNCCGNGSSGSDDNGNGDSYHKDDGAGVGETVQDDLPLLKIIGDGDDITCILAGQYGISFAAELLRTIESLGCDADMYPFPKWDEILPDVSKPRISASAGVVIFHSHFPFSAAYKMAEECCANAKRYTRKSQTQMLALAQMNTNSKTQTQVGADVVTASIASATATTGSFIDFHLHQSGAIVNINQMRNKQYMTNIEDEVERVYNRPYCVSDGDYYEAEYPMFSDFERIMKTWVLAHIYHPADTKTWPRSRLKALRDAIPTGSNEVMDVINWCKSRGFELPAKYDEKLAKIDQNSRPKIIKSKYSLLFDVLEFADIYEDITRGTTRDITSGITSDTTNNITRDTMKSGLKKDITTNQGSGVK